MTSCDITLGQHGYVHGDAVFHNHSCRCEYLSGETDGSAEL